MPTLRGLSKKYKNLSLADSQALLQSPIHEYRVLALMILCLQYKKADSSLRQDIYSPYLSELARSDNLRERRVAIIGTSVYIGTGDTTTTLRLSEILLNDKHDLIHKASRVDAARSRQKG